MEAVAKLFDISREVKGVTDHKLENSPYHCGVTNYSEKPKQSLAYYESERIIFLSYMPSANSNVDVRLEDVMQSNISKPVH